MQNESYRPECNVSGIFVCFTISVHAKILFFEHAFKALISRAAFLPSKTTINELKTKPILSFDRN